jgi:hypothetical protein
MMGTMMAVAAVVPPERTEWLSRLYCRGQVAMTGARWRSVVDPAVDPARPYLFACNHVNLLDHVTMYNSTPHFKQGLELESHFKIPVYGWFMKQRGTIPVKKGVAGGAAGRPARVVPGRAREGALDPGVPGGHPHPGRLGGAVPQGRVRDLPRAVPADRAGHGHRDVRDPPRRQRPDAAGPRGHRVLRDAPIEPGPVGGDDDLQALADRVRSVIAARVDAHRSGP